MSKTELRFVRGNIDDALGVAQDWADTDGVDVEINNVHTGETEGIVKPMPQNGRKSFGTSKEWDNAWTAFKARQEAAKALGGTEKKKRKTDD